jgi:hypothetical protein
MNASWQHFIGNDRSLKTISKGVIAGGLSGIATAFSN